ncbi:carboxypeptidase M32 [Rickettsia rickettsii]|uniref:Metal-dependent carboxypeptidase n=3 Tax=Rickettsia rickettsii TaxID=783 RepID=B0BWG6_RICRO|nr:carboxypeptidase M32 [Rickettsia rickettsii]ABV75841.1 thermostable carboxypeptidase [Rickettsia rickettsii str. 'Sheila Smith']ABY72192.1 thermostable carboxypeptidase 1 [Rickettsia rickettsii str. Iowa]AFB22594.1 thermostable carboxypeptidase [Rickettsia rickettsii str. Brazil]AFB23170.1 thermostable carboxypeptidase [Rickettsia rickettsii str. Colombia]AFB24522.1 thermostable carboxypeptidase [Rickettsia rickettsii str. Arizona]
MNNNYTKLENEFATISHFNNILSILYWDVAVNMPMGSGESRTNEIVTLTSLVHSMLKSPILKELLSKAKEESKNLDEWQNGNIREIERKVTDANCIDEQLQKKLVAATTKAALVWREARKHNDYNLFKSHLQKVLDYTKEVAKVRADAFNCELYNSLIDMFDPSRKSSEIKQVFSVLKKELPQLINKVLEKQKTEKELVKHSKLAPEMQKRIGKRIMEIMQFDLTKGRLDESTHPFCGGTPNDIRLTTRYDKDNFISGLMGIIHETGHALYEQNLPEMYKGQPVGLAKGMAFHESQALFMEMQVGRSREFTEFLAKLLRDEFALKSEEYSAASLYRKITRVTPDFIRVDADELTYPMHVMLRFEIEEMLINSDLNLDELPSCWDSKMQEYLGVKPVSFSNGCLQDIHWSHGNFGYFPAYTNGAIIASMVMKKVTEMHSNIKDDILKGDFSNLNNYLNKNFRNLGSLKNSADLLKSASGEEKISPEVYIRYLEGKYL